jgi:hypothetical protein
MVIPVLRFGGLAAAAIVCALSFSSVALAESRGADLRVVNTAGRTLAEFRQYTGTTRIRTDPEARCFGQGTGGSGNSVQITGSTALGAIRDAIPSDPDLAPLSVTDAFADQGFGLGVCGIGGFRAQGSSFWYLKRNHLGAQVSGSQLKVRQGDDILWYLTPSYPPPPELVLQAPARAKPNVPFQVTVYSYADNGTRRPAAGASVTDAAAATDANGHTMVSSPAGTHALRATRGQNIPSNHVSVCVAADLTGCPDAHGVRILGSNHADVIDGTRGWDAISARGGKDQVDIRSGGRDQVTCGVGADRVILRAGDTNDHISASCEQVVRK